jgi:hypothetical protein
LFLAASFFIDKSALIALEFQISSSSRLLHAVARLSAHFAAGEMPQLEQQQQQQQQPLCTHQYSSAFGTYRKPTLSQDTLIKTPSSCHALVISNGHMFSVPIKVIPFLPNAGQSRDPC